MVRPRRDCNAYVTPVARVAPVSTPVSGRGVFAIFTAATGPRVVTGTGARAYEHVTTRKVRTTVLRGARSGAGGHCQRVRPGVKRRKGYGVLRAKNDDQNFFSCAARERRVSYDVL